MAEDHLTFGHIPSLDECLVFAQKENVPLGLIVIGGVAMELYGLPRGTLDIDAEIACDPDFFEALVLHLKKKGIQFNLGDDVDHRGVIPLPAGYRDRATTVFEKGGTVVKILDPLDFVASKLRRGIEQDLKDALSVSHHFSFFFLGAVCPDPYGKDQVSVERRNISFQESPAVIFGGTADVGRPFD